MQRRKGATYEREIVHELRRAGFTGAKRTALLQTHGFEGAADVLGLPGCHIECKRQETVRIQEWCEQAERDAPEGAVPVVVWRRSGQPSRVTFPLADFLAMQSRLNGGGDTDG